jgi:hypothetical protein
MKMYGNDLSSLSRTLYFGFNCLIRFCSSRRASVSVIVVKNIIDVVSEIIRVILDEWLDE